MAYGNCVPLRDVFIRGSQHITRSAAAVALWVEGLAVQGAEGGSEGEKGRRGRRKKRGRGGKRDGDSAAIKAVRATLSRQ